MINERRIFDISESVTRLSALFHVCRELMRLEAAWLAGVPYWDAKLAIGRHVLEDAGHAGSILKRLHELKAASAEHRQPTGVDELVQEIARASNGDEWLHGLYGAAKPWLVSQIQDYLDCSDPLMDEPTRRILEPVLVELERQVRWFGTFKPQFSAWENPDVTSWTDWLRQVLSAARIDERGLVVETKLEARPSGHPDFAGIAMVRRDRTFKTVNERSVTVHEESDFSERRFDVFYNHTQEMQFAESLGAIMQESGAMPWAFHADLARHISDEVRHAHMGQLRIEQLGSSLKDIPMMTQHYEFRSHLNPLERFCLMTLVMEATSFERKRANVELFESNEDETSARYETYDIRDEMLHTNLGHIWVPIMLRVYQDARSVAQLTEHCRNMIAQVISEYPTNAATMVRT